MDLGLNGKVVMVGGGTRGLGYATARALAREGARVSIIGRQSATVQGAAERLRGETGAEVIGFAGDLRDADAVPAWTRATVDAFGGVRLLFANTGGPPPGRFESIDDDAWRAGVDLLLLPVIRMARETIPLMKAGGGGAIVISTSSGVKVPILNLTLSTVLRASVAALSRTLAEQYAADGIRVNQIVPGRIDTERVRSMDRVNAEKAGIDVAEQELRSFATIPLGRYGRTEEYGEAAAFLLSERASYITGSTLVVDGGLIRAIM